MKATEATEVEVQKTEIDLFIDWIAKRIIDFFYKKYSVGAIRKSMEEDPEFWEKWFYKNKGSLFAEAQKKQIKFSDDFELDKISPELMAQMVREKINQN